MEIKFDGLFIIWGYVMDIMSGVCFVVFWYSGYGFKMVIKLDVSF